MHAPSSRSLRALISISALTLTSAAPLVTASAQADSPQAHARAHSHHRAHDRDHDGMPNRWERRHGLNPDRANGHADNDHDGLTNRQEFKKHLNPKAGDSDHDGLRDGREVRLGTNPRSADSDHDGLKDGREVRLGTDPTSADSDGDGVKDGTEVAKGTDPTAPPKDTTPPGDTGGTGGTTTPPGDTGGTTTPPGDTGGTGGTGGSGGGTPTVAPPVITDPTGSTNDTTPLIKGTGVTNDTVTVTLTRTDQSAPAATAADTLASPNIPPTTITLGPVAVDDGTWQVATDALDDGTYSVSAVQHQGPYDSAPSAPRTFTVDTATPDAPVVSTPADGAMVGSGTPTITGTGEPGDTITVALPAGDSQMPALGTTTVDEQGHWSVDSLTTTLHDGSNTIEVTQTDAAGNPSQAATRTFTVDATAPAPPTIEPVDDILAGGDTTPAITGSVAEDGDTVTVTLHREGTTSDDDQSFTPEITNGTWQVTPAALTDGDYKVTATESDAAGNTSEASETFTVDTVAPDMPTIKPVDDIAIGGTNPPAITGTGTAGDQVIVTLNGAEQDPVDINEDGDWSFTPANPLGDDTYTITAVETDAAGNTSDSTAQTTFTVDTQAPAAPSITSPQDGSTVTESTPTIAGTGAGAGEFSVKLVDGNDNPIALDEPLIDEGGAWSVTPSQQLTDGTYTVTVSQTDTVGNPSTESTSTFTVDTTQGIPGGV